MGSHDVIQSGVNPRNLESDMRYEENRLSTFNRWPASAKVDSRKIAKAGFFYTGNNFEVQCFICDVKISDWEYGDIVTAKHRQLNPNCPFVLDPCLPINVPLTNGPSTLLSGSSLPSGSSGFVSGMQDSATSSLTTQFRSSFHQDSYSESTQVAARDSSLPSVSEFSSTSVNPSDLPSVTPSPYSTLQHNDIVISGLSSSENDNGWTNVESQHGALRLHPAYRRTQTWYNLEYLKREDERLKTFEGWPLTSIQPATLAKAGFFYLKKADNVQCAFCRGMVGEWEEGDNPWEEHGRHFPRCPFINNLPVGNVSINASESETLNNTSQSQDTCERRAGPDLVSRGNGKLTSGPYNITLTKKANETSLEGLGITAHHGPAHPNYATFGSRLKTFRDWPPALRQKPSNIAEAGFYYVGLSDHVKCFHCDGGLRNWQPEDDPWTEHARWFSKCGFVLLVKGEEFVKQAIVKLPPVLPPELLEPGPSSRLPPSGNTFHVQNASGASSGSSYMVRQVTEEEVEGLMRTPVAQAVLDMGMDPSSVREVLREKMQQTGLPFTSVDDLIASLLENEHQTETEEAGTSSETVYSQTSTMSTVSSVDDHASEEEMMSVTSISNEQNPEAGPEELPSEQTSEVELEEHVSSLQRQNSAPVPASPHKIKRESAVVSFQSTKSVLDQSRFSVSLPIISGKNQISQSEKDNAEELEEENRKLKEARMCKICMDEEVGVVFLPCGHLVTCVNCAPALKDCPLCRQPIKGLVRTFLS